MPAEPTADEAWNAAIEAAARHVIKVHGRDARIAAVVQSIRALRRETPHA